MFQETALRRVMKKQILCLYGPTFCNELSDHVHHYSTLAQPWLPVAALCSMMNARYITAQNFGVLASG